MFHNSSHRKYWIFKSEEEVENMRYRANQKFRNKILESGRVSTTHNQTVSHLLDSWRYLFSCLGLNQPGVSDSTFLERHEEEVLFRHYERRMLDFCNAFKPAMPKSVVVCMRVLCARGRQIGPHCLIPVPFTCAGHSHHVLQKILPQQLHHGVPPQDHHVGSLIVSYGMSSKSAHPCNLT